MISKFSLSLFGVLFLISISSCGQIDPNNQIEEGKVVADVYTSQDIGWTIKIPKNWTVVTKEQHDEYEQKGLEAMEEIVDGEIDVSGLKDLIGFQKNQFNSFGSTSEPFELEYEGEWEEINASLKILLYDTYKNQGVNVDTTITEYIEIDGLEFQKFGIKIFSPNGTLILTQIMYSRLINGFDFGVNLNYNNKADMKEMQDAWLNSKFKK